MKRTLFPDPKARIEAIGRLDNLIVSEPFLVCADKKLCDEYEKQTGLFIENRPQSLLLPFEELNYIKGEVSSFSAKIYVNRRYLLTKICWRSKSGRVYEMADTNIDTDDIVFWFDPIEKDKGIKHIFFYIKDYNLTVKRNLGIDMSEIFCEYAEEQLRHYFEHKTGIKINHRVSTDWGREDLKYHEGEVSSIEIQLSIGHNFIGDKIIQNKVKVCWRSKSGRVYKMADEDIDLSDIVFWFEGLDPISYHKQLYPNDPLPFKLKKPHFELAIHSIDLNMVLEIFLKESDDVMRDEIIAEISKFISTWNEKTEKEDAIKQAQGITHYDSNGVVDSIKITESRANRIEIQLNMGTSDIILLKKLVQMLDKKYKTIEKVIVS
jgi:hypothetical protein